MNDGPFSDKETRDAYAKALGLLVLEVSATECVMTDLAAILLRTDIVRTIAIFHHQQMANKADSLLALCHLIYGDDKRFTRIFDWIRKAKNISEFRNSLVHAYWSSEEGIALTVRFSARGQFKRTRKLVAIQEIEEHALEAREIRKKLEEFRDFYHRSPDTSPPGIEFHDLK